MLKILNRVYDNLDLQVLNALLEYETSSECLEFTGEFYYLNLTKNKNLLYRQKGDFEWVHSLTVPLWREIINVEGDAWSEEALKHVAKTLLFKGTLLESDMDALLKGYRFKHSKEGSILNNFPPNSF